MIYKSETLDTINMDAPTAQSMLKVEMEKVQKLLEVILTRRKSIFGTHNHNGYRGVEKEVSDIDEVIVNVQRVISELSLMIVSETTYSLSKIELDELEEGEDLLELFESLSPLDDYELTSANVDSNEMTMRKERLGKGVPANKIVKILHSMPKLGNEGKGDDVIDHKQPCQK